MFLNLFSTVFDFSRNIASTSADETRQEQAWNLYLEEFISGSAEAREICERPGFAKLYSDEVPSIPLYYNVRVIPHVAALTGPVAMAPPLWNVHLWELR